MRIGIACPYSWDVPGGVQQHIRDLAEALIGMGHEISVIAPADDDRPLPDYIVPAGKAMPVPYNGSVARLAFGPLSVSRVRRWLKDGGFDVLHVHEPTVPSLSLLACWVASGPIVATVHTAMRRSRVLLATQPVMRSALEKIDGRIAVSEAARTTLVEHLGGDAVLIPNGVATRRYRHARPLDGWPGAGGAIGFLGRMEEPRKGLAVLLKAFEILAAERPRLRLLIAGPGDADEQRHKLPAALRDRAVFLGEVTEEEKVRVLHRSTCSARRTRAASRSASSPPRRWRPGCRSSPATSRPSGRSCAAAARASCSSPGTPKTWPRRRRGCSTTRRAAPSSRWPRSPRSPTTTGTSSPAR